MKGTLKFLLPGALAASTLSTTFLTPQAASANLVRDMGVGAAGNAVAGKILHNGSTLGNAASGAAVGAAIHIVDRKRHSTLAKDVGVGAATNVVTGIVFDNGHVFKNALSGAATGAVIHVIHK